MFHSAADRYALLPDDADFVYDFNTAGPELPNRKLFPALVGADVSMATAVFPGKFFTVASLLHQDSPTDNVCV